MKTYHKDIFLPNNLYENIPKELKIYWSYHATQASRSDKYGKIPIVNRISFSKEFLVEYTQISNRHKLLLRIPYNDYDICLVILSRNTDYVVKTAWLNHKDDIHSTLDKTKYVHANRL